ncbi:MAG: hypothetical protein ACOYXB_17720 [Bacteroidota bacterium]
MSILYRFHEKYTDSILIRDFTGKVDVDQIIASWEYLMENRMLGENIRGVINNLSTCELEMNMESFKKLIAYLGTHQEFSRIKLAVITANPKVVVFPALGENIRKNLSIRPFSTEEAAVFWIVSEA